MYISTMLPIDVSLMKAPIKRFQIYLSLCTLIFLIIISSFFIFPCFWNGNIIWSLGNYITLTSIITNQYFDIKKNSNPNNQAISIPVLELHILKWLKIEKIISYIWILGTLLIILARWIKL